MKHKETVAIQSIYKIAKEASVSPATVSRVLNNKTNVRSATRIRILNIIEKHNFKPRLVKAKTFNIGILVQNQNGFFGHYLTEVINGVFDYCIEYDYNLQLFSIHEKRMQREGILNTLRENKIDGMIVLLNNNESYYINDAIEEKYPYIIINNGMHTSNVNYINIDNDSGILNALQYLKTNGHKKIAFLCGDVPTKDHEERLIAYQKYMREFGLYNEEFIIEFIRPQNYLNSFEQGYQQINQSVEMLKQNQITAVLANNDDQAIGAMRALGQNRIAVPDDISIIGFDDYHVSNYTNPPLTTVHQPLFQMGRTAAAKLIPLITGANNNKIHVLLKPELIIRKSVKILN